MYHFVLGTNGQIHWSEGNLIYEAWQMPNLHIKKNFENPFVQITIFWIGLFLEEKELQYLPRTLSRCLEYNMWVETGGFQSSQKSSSNKKECPLGEIGFEWAPVYMADWIPKDNIHKIAFLF